MLKFWRPVPVWSRVPVAFCAKAWLTRSGKTKATARSFNFRFVFMYLLFWFGLWLVFLLGSVIDVNNIF
jgi:hypothetical protein